MSTQKSRKRVRKGVKNTTKKIINDDLEKGIESVMSTAQSFKENTQKTGEIILKKAERIIQKKETEKKFFVEYENTKVDSDKVTEKFYEVWNKNHEEADIQSLSIYYKVEDKTAYCVVNDNIKVNIKLL